MVNGIFLFLNVLFGSHGDLRGMSLMKSLSLVVARGLVSLVSAL